jgi:ABC-type sugar transport system ATPase subunit
MTCYENLALNLRLRKLDVTEIEQRVRETAAMLQITDLLEKKPRELSGGQRQRVAVGRALIRRPRIFLLDEPLSNLDPLLRERVRHEFKELFRKVQVPVIYVTHDQTEAMTLADRIALLDQGRLQQVGTPEELYQRPANRFVASFIGSPSMNFFETTLSRGTFSLAGVQYDTELRVSGPVIIGIRPEAVQVDPGAGAVYQGPKLKGRVCWVEALGAHFLAGVEVGGAMLAALLRNRPIAEMIDLAIDHTQVHVFDIESGKNLRVHRP